MCTISDFGLDFDSLGGAQVSVKRTPVQCKAIHWRGVVCDRGSWL